MVSRVDDQAWRRVKSWPVGDPVGDGDAGEAGGRRRHGAVVGVLQGDGIGRTRRRGAPAPSVERGIGLGPGHVVPADDDGESVEQAATLEVARRPTRAGELEATARARPAVTAASIRSTTPGSRSMASISSWCWACRAGTTVSRSMGRPRSASSISLQWTWSAVPTISCHTARSSSTPCSSQTSAAVEKADHSVSRIRPSKSKTRACSLTGGARPGRRPARDRVLGGLDVDRQAGVPGGRRGDRARCRRRVAGPGRRPATSRKRVTVDDEVNVTTSAAAAASSSRGVRAPRARSGRPRPRRRSQPAARRPSGRVSRATAARASSTRPPPSGGAGKASSRPSAT